MNNEPVAWMETYCGKPSSLVWSKEEAETIHPYDAIPLYTHSAKTLTDDEIYKLVGEFWIDGSFDDGELDYVGFARAILKKASFTCNGFCGEQECKENQDDCKRIKKASEK